MLLRDTSIVLCYVTYITSCKGNKYNFTNDKKTHSLVYSLFTFVVE